MHYVISDIHGYNKLYHKLLEKVNFSDEDILYVLGDVTDRGEHPMAVLLDMMKRKNIVPVMGNHEYMALRMLTKMNETLQDDYDDEEASYDDFMLYNKWLREGGRTTMEDFRGLSQKDRDAVLEYLKTFVLYAEAEVSGRKYLMVHAGLENFSPDKKISDYTMEELIFERIDYAKKYYEDTTIITGHTPTFMIETESEGKIYKANNHIAMDCGAAYGDGLGMLCLETMEEIYAGGNWESMARVKNC